MFYLRFYKQYFPTIWKKEAVVLVSAKGSNASVTNSTPMTILNDLSKLFYFVIYCPDSHNLIFLSRNAEVLSQYVE